MFGGFVPILTSRLTVHQIDSFLAGYLVIPMGYLVFKFGFLPKIIRALLIVAGFVYLRDSFILFLSPTSA